MPTLTADTTDYTGDSSQLTADLTSVNTVIVGNSVKREAACAIRSSRGMAILDETYEYLVRCDAKDTPYVEVLNTPGLPIVNYSVSPSGYGICRNKSGVRRVDNPYYWDITCDFSSEVEESQDNPDPTTDPTSWIPIYETKFERLQEVVTKDLNGVSIANSAGQPFENGLTIARFIPIWEFWQLEPGTITDEQILERNESVNSGTFRNRIAKTLLLTVNSSVVGFYYGQRRRLTQYSLRYNSKKWTHKRLDVGTVYKDGSDHKPYLDKNGNVILGGLNGIGSKVLVGDPPAVREFDMYPSISFSFIRVPV